MQPQVSDTYLYNLRVVEPLTEYSLYESKHLLQNHHHLKNTNSIHCFTYLYSEKGMYVKVLWRRMEGVGRKGGGRKGGVGSSVHVSC